MYELQFISFKNYLVTESCVHKAFVPVFDIIIHFTCSTKWILNSDSYVGLIEENVTVGGVH